MNTLISTGELSLFQDSEKMLIIQLKEALDRYKYYEATEIETAFSDFRGIKNEFDLVSAYGYSGDLGDQDMRNQELSDVHYFKYRNYLAELLNLYKLQSAIYKRISKLSTELVIKLKESKG